MVVSKTKLGIAIRTEQGKLLAWFESDEDFNKSSYGHLLGTVQVNPYYLTKVIKAR